ncbi:2,3-dihydro-2,3-dihydroxybenzoate dehydrogenase [Amycolatopsis sp. CA-230715]|nr:2,3-dihydro-2,3-dihydroxybenzoate dehydrogenase [Amycolatopsis sp. CA-230715]
MGPGHGDTGIAGSIALVTGAARGIGAAVVAGLVREGATVAAVDVDVTGLAKIAEGSDGRVVPFTADVGDPASFTRVVEAAERDLGPIDIGVSVAGILVPGQVRETSDEDWAATFAVNSTGVFTVLRELSRHMLPRRRGALVTVGSNAAGVAADGHGRLRRVEGGRDHADPLPRTGARRARHPVQCGLPRLDRHPDAASAMDGRKRAKARHITMQDLFVDGGATLRA